MSSRLPLLLYILAPIASAQTPDPAASQKVLEELRGMRSLLNQLAQAVNTLQQGQKGQLALARIQIDESRVASLEVQKLQLISREQELEKEVAAASAFLRGEEGGASSPVAVSPTVAADSTGAAAGILASRLAQAKSALDETRRARASVEGRIVALRARIDRMEQFLEEAMR
jgi:hypothetical protein